ncbi:dermonecrotic toxin domain-containing protein [Pseudomonas sp. E102]|uniref:dermonecrotic toxin domain-containing protein n=1 Tax=Pseudomonas sp. E102 TaxID=181579 RepID=UPI00404538CE
MTTLLTDESNAPLQAPPVTLVPLDKPPGGHLFEPHEFADQWLSALGLRGDTALRVTYQEVKAVDSAAEYKVASVPLRAAVTQGFSEAYQSKPVSPIADYIQCESWIKYPHRSRMRLDFSALRIDGHGLSNTLLRKLRAGIPPGYRGPVQPFDTGGVSQNNPPDPYEAARRKQLVRLETHLADLARLFAGLPTFDTVLKNLLVDSIREKIDPGKPHGAVAQAIDPDNCYVNRYTTDSLGKRSLVSSMSLSAVMMDCLGRDTPPAYGHAGVGFFTRSDSVEEADSLFVDPVDANILGAMKSALYIPNPTTSNRLHRRFLDDLAAFHSKETPNDSLDPVTSSTALDELALRLSQRFLYVFDLYKADRDRSVRLTQAARSLQYDEDRLLSLITTHPSEASRTSLMSQAGVPHVYEVMLEMDSGVSRKWPAAMVIRQSDRQTLFLYSLEGGLQRFDEFQEMVDSIMPLHEGKKRKIRNIDQALKEHVFEVAAKDLLDLQYAALQAVLRAPEKVQFDLARFALEAEAALQLPILALDGLLIARGETLFKNSRPNAYRVATLEQKRTYRALENEVLEADRKMADKRVHTLSAFARERLIDYLRAHWHVDIDPDPDRTLITLFQGSSCTPKDSRATSLTQLMIDNTRPPQYSNAMREIRPVYLVDKEGVPICHPVTGCFIVLKGPELAKMATDLDIGGNYETFLDEKLNASDYRNSWWDAYRANLAFKGYEAGLKGDDVLKAVVIDADVKPGRPKKIVELWLDAVLNSSSVKERKRVQGREVHVHGLLLGGAMGAQGQHGTLRSTTTIDGALVFSDQEGPTIHGTVGVYFPDSPGGDDFREFSDLGDGIAALLQHQQWQAYFSSRIATNNPQEIKQALGQRSGRPLVRGSLIADDLAEALHGAHLRYRVAHADHRSTSNREVLHQTIFNLTVMAFEALLDVVSFFCARLCRLTDVFMGGQDRADSNAPEHRSVPARYRHRTAPDHRCGGTLTKPIFLPGGNGQPA